MSRGRVLVVDDERGMRDMLAFELGADDFDITAAESGEEAVLLAKNHKYDVVITDLRMPGMDGVETLTALKQLDPAIEVIVATGFGTIETAISCMKLGAYDYIQKPYNVVELVLLLTRALEKSHLQGMLALYEASHSLLTTQDLTYLLQLITDLATRVLLTDATALVLSVPGSKEPEVHRSRGTVDPSADFLKELARRATEAGVALRLPFPKVHDVPMTEVDRTFNECFVYPLIVRGQTLGALILLRSDALPHFTTSEFQRGAVFAAQATLALHTARVVEELDKRAADMKLQRDAALMQAHGDVEQKVVERTAHLTETNQELAESLRKLRETQDQLLQATNVAAIGTLVAGLSHNLNNPIGVIIGFAQILLKRMAANDPLHMPVASIEREAQRCAQLVKAMLDFTRPTRKARERIAASTLLQRVADLASGPAQRRAVSLEIDPSCDLLPDVSVNPIEVQSALLNVLTNALDATANGGTVVLKAQEHVRDEVAGVEVSISDSGHGIPEELLPRLFEPFFSHEAPPDGTHIGLSIAKQVMDAHAGKLWVAENSDRGTTLCLWLPLAMAGRTAQEQQA